MTSQKNYATLRANAAAVTRHAANPFGHRPIPCVHELEVLESCGKCHNGARHVRGCELHDKCTRAFVSHRQKSCALCTDYQPGAERWEWIGLDDLVRDTVHLAGRLPRDLSGVGGVPRSGMIPASILACQLHLPLWEVGEEGSPYRLRSGNRGRGLEPAGKLLVVDDSVYAGSARRRVRESLSGIPHWFGAIYCRDGSESHVDFFARSVTSLHVLEWNWSTNGGIRGWSHTGGGDRGFGTDLDGIVVHDDLSGGVPGSRYMVPSNHPIPLICTGRPERDRERTEHELRVMGAKWDVLKMLPDTVVLTPQSAAQHKAHFVTSRKLELFFESCPQQAALIHTLSGKPVICPRAKRVWQ